MFMIRTVLLILILAITASCQPNVITLPKGVLWDFEYADYDSTMEIVFDVFYKDVEDTSYALLDSTYTKDLDLLQFQMLYDNRACSTWVRARGRLNGAVSLPSNTIYIWFPLIITNQPYSFEVYGMEIPK